MGVYQNAVVLVSCVFEGKEKMEAFVGGCAIYDELGEFTPQHILTSVLINVYNILGCIYVRTRGIERKMKMKREIDCCDK